MPRRDTVYFIYDHHADRDEAEQEIDRWTQAGWDVTNPQDTATPAERVQALLASSRVAIVPGWDTSIYAKAEAVVAAFAHLPFHSGDSMGPCPTPSLVIERSPFSHVG